MPLANPNQNPNEAEALEPQAVNQNGEEIRQLLAAVRMTNNTIVRLNNTNINMEREERINNQHDAGTMPLADSNQHPNGAEAPEPQDVDQTIEDIRQLIMGMGLSHENVVQLTAALNNLTVALNKERKEFIESQELLQSKIDQNKAKILQNKADILQLQQGRAEDKAEKEELKHKLDEEMAAHQVLENKVEELIALSSQK